MPINRRGSATLLIVSTWGLLSIGTVHCESMSNVTEEPHNGLGKTVTCEVSQLQSQSRAFQPNSMSETTRGASAPGAPVDPTAMDDKD